MPVPKSVTKINKNGITFTSDVDKANYFIWELSRAALRDVSKLVRKRFREKFYSVLNKITGKAPKSYGYKVLSSKNTTAPRVEIGYQRASRAKVVEGFYASFQELGTKHQKAQGVLKSVVEDSVADIINIESQYLSGLEEEARALAMIETEDEMDDDNE